MKKVVSIVLSCLIILALPYSVLAESKTYDMESYYEDVYLGYHYSLDKVWEQFLKDNENVDYCRIIDNLSDSQWALDFSSYLLKEKLDEKKYKQILSGFIAGMAYDFNEYIEHQKDMDSLKSAVDYTKDVFDIVLGTAGIDASESKALTKDMLERFNNLEDKLENVRKIEDIFLEEYKDIETYFLILDNYSMCIEFLNAIEIYAEDPELVNAAESLKRTTGYTLEYYLSKISEDPSELAEFIGGDIIFKMIVPELLKSPEVFDISQEDFETLTFLNDSFNKVMELSGTGETVFNLCIFGGDMIFGTTNTYKRYNELLALKNIRTALNQSVAEKIGKIKDKEQMEDIKAVANLLQNILYVDYRGYYSIYHLLENDSQLLSLINFDNYDTYESWYQNAENFIIDLKDIVDDIFPDIENYMVESRDILESDVYEIYEPVLEQYQKAINNGLYMEELWSIDYEGMDNNEYMEMEENFIRDKGVYLEHSIFVYAKSFDQYRPVELQNSGNSKCDVVYSFTDLNNDGISELLIGGSSVGGLEPDTVHIYNIFSYDGQNIVPLFEVSSVGWRQSLSVLKDNRFLLSDSKGIKNKIYYLSNNNCKPILDEMYIVDYDIEMDLNENEASIAKKISSDELDEKLEKIGYKELSWTAFRPDDEYLIENPDNEEIPQGSALKQQAIAEVEAVAAQVAELENRLQTDGTMNQADINQCVGQIYQLWDDELNVLWAYLKQSLSEEDMSALKAEELEWISYKESEVFIAGSEYEGGSMRPMVEANKAASLTKVRVYELLEMIP